MLSCSRLLEDGKSGSSRSVVRRPPPMLAPQRYLSKAVNHAGPKVLLAPPDNASLSPSAPLLWTNSIAGVFPRLRNCGAGTTTTVALASRNRNEHSKASSKFVGLPSHPCLPRGDRRQTGTSCFKPHKGRAWFSRVTIMEEAISVRPQKSATQRVRQESVRVERQR